MLLERGVRYNWPMRYSALYTCVHYGSIDHIYTNATYAMTTLGPICMVASCIMEAMVSTTDAHHGDQPYHAVHSRYPMVVTHDGADHAYTCYARFTTMPLLARL